MPCSQAQPCQRSPMLGSAQRAPTAGQHLNKWQRRAPRPLPLAPSGSGGAVAAAARAPCSASSPAACTCSNSSSSTRQRARTRPAEAPGRLGFVAALAASSGTASAAAGAGEAVVIVDHGSRKKESNDMLLEFVALYKQLTGRTLVEPAHMELAEPTISQAVARCAAAGAQRVVVAPYFLSRGRHVQQDIPSLVAEAAAAHPGVECLIAEPIGIDSLMAQLIENRVQAAVLPGAAAATDSAAAVAAGGGSGGGGSSSSSSSGE